MSNKIAHRLLVYWGNGRWLSSAPPTTAKLALSPVRLQRPALAQALGLTAAETGTFYVVCRGGLRRLADAFAMANQVLCSAGACITDLMVKEGLVISTSRSLLKS